MSDLMVRDSGLFGTRGTPAPFTAGASSGQRTQDAHARFMDANLAGRVFATGTAAGLSISNVTFTLATTGATATPIIGVWNPATSPVNLIIWQGLLAVYMTTLTGTVGPGGFVWMASTAQAATLTLAVTPYNRRTLVASGSFARGLNGAALTGLSGTLLAMCASQLNGGSGMTTAFTETAVGARPMNATSVENIDGAIVVPPGGVLALMASVTPVGHTALSGLVWEEVPILP